MAMSCGSRETGWLGIEVRPDLGSIDWNCTGYTVTWGISG